MLQHFFAEPYRKDGSRLVADFYTDPLISGAEFSNMFSRLNMSEKDFELVF